MSEERKKQLFRFSYWGALVLYGWEILMLWVGPSWGLDGWSYYFVAVVPAVVAVTLLATALGLYLDLREWE